MKNGQQKHTNYTYDNNGKRYTYDAYGNMLTKNDRNGTVSEYAYNHYGITSETAGEDALSYTYDALGRTLTKTSSNDSVSYSYDAFGRVISETDNGRTKNYTYDANSNVTAFTLNNGDTQEQSIAYTYDDINRLTNMTADGKIFSYTYDAVGNLTQKSAGNITTNYSYNSANMITALENLSGAQTLNRYTYGYSVDGNRISDVEEGGISKSYNYDGLGRLINETQTQDGVSVGYTYGYNAAGNRTSLSVTGAESYTVSYAYDANNRLTAQNKTIGARVETTNYSYDPNGNLIAEWNSVTAPKSGAEPTLNIGVVGKDSTGVSLYEYDSRNRLVKAAGDFGTAEYAYNVNGLRKSKTVNGTTTGFIWNGMNMIAETSGNAISVNYTYDITGIAMSKQNGAYQYYLKNAHGDVTGLANESGTLIQNYIYDAFGNQLNTDDTDTNPFRYAGEYYDTETDSIYLRNRYYSPSIGRFITEDPIKDGLNWYVYCGNNPITFVDPYGLAITDEDQKAYEIGLLSEANYQMLVEADKLWKSAADDDYETKTEAREMAVAARRTYNPDYVDDFDYSFGGKNLSNVTVVGNTQVGSNTAANPWIFAAAVLATLFVVRAGETWQEIADSRPSSYTPIYRTGSDTYYNLTPRKVDVAGLSYSTIRPTSGTYTATTMEAVNATGILVAIKDGATHVSVKSTYDHEGWIESKETANQYPHPCAVALKNISLRLQAGK